MPAPVDRRPARIAPFIPDKPVVGVKVKKLPMLWEGPQGTGPQGGTSQSLIKKWLVCKHRTWLLVRLGLHEKEEFSHRLEFGNMWHKCEEALAGHKDWKKPLLGYAEELMKKYPGQGEQVRRWYDVCKLQFPIYVDYWKHHADVKTRVPICQEGVFDVWYPLPSGRKVRLRGKFDSVDLIGPARGIYVQEDKAKGDPDEQQIKRELTFNLQTMVYVIALQQIMNDPDSCNRGREIAIELSRHKEWKTGGKRVAGVRYNVIKRPLSGGKHSIKQHEGRGKAKKGAETMDQFHSRLAGLIKGDPEFFFMRWKVELIPDDLFQFARQSLNPILEMMCDWYNKISIVEDPFDPAVQNGCHATHFRMPYGVYNALSEGRMTPYDEYLRSGSKLGLEKTNELFRELKEPV